HDNGHLSRIPGKGGVIVQQSSFILLQYNESYRNVDLSNLDGQGFCFVGVTDSVMQYNYSHENGNGGFQLTIDWPFRSPNLRNVIRYNVSENDKVGIVVFYETFDADVYNNTVYGSFQPGTFRVPAIVGYWTGARVHFWNNIFDVEWGMAAI